MTEEDEEFNRIEREASLRKAAVHATVSQHKPMHPEIKKMYEDYFDKCFRESSREQREWVGLTDDAEILAISHTMPYANRFEFARAIEAHLKELNT